MQSSPNFKLGLLQHSTWFLWALISRVLCQYTPGYQVVKWLRWNWWDQPGCVRSLHSWRGYLLCSFRFDCKWRDLTLKLNRPAVFPPTADEHCGNSSSLQSFQLKLNPIWLVCIFTLLLFLKIKTTDKLEHKSIFDLAISLLTLWAVHCGLDEVIGPHL